MKSAYSDDWSTIYNTDALTGLQALPGCSVHCAITSPPYWGLRSYLPVDHPDKAMELGAEKTPEAYVERLIEVFRALKRVLRDDATLWLNLGDSYASSGVADPDSLKKMGARLQAKGHRWSATGHGGQGRAPTAPGLKTKDLVGIPWMVAFALRADGWYLRSDIVWSKPNPMPESVTDRPTKSHEYLFLLTKSPRYFFDQEAVREKTDSNPLDGRRGNGGAYAFKPTAPVTHMGVPNGGRNIRSVWSIATQPYPGAHYATFPPDLVYPCIRAGTSERGVCEACGAPWERVVEREHNGPSTRKARITAEGFKGRIGASDQKFESTGKMPGSDTRGLPSVSCHTLGWQPTCSCNGEYIKEPYEVSVVNRETGEPETFTRYRSVYVPGIPLSEHPVVPATVLDPFMGSGTTALAARKLGRRSIGFDLDERNVKQIERRLGTQGVLL